MIIALDIGGTKIAAALVDGNEIVERRSAASVIHSDLNQLVPTIQLLCRDWIAKAVGIGVGCTGLVGEGSVHFLSAGADKVMPLQTKLQQVFELPVVILNDAWAAAWGEYKLGKHTANNTLVYITVSTGIGGGIVQNGQLITSLNGFAAHIGHLTVSRPDGQDIPCTCGRMNCVEAVASGTAIGRRASRLLQRVLDCREAFSIADSVPGINALIDDCAVAIAQLIANVKAVTGTEVVVLGGSVGLASGFRERVHQALTSLPDIYGVDLQAPALGSDADTLGAALAIQDSLIKSAERYA